MEMDKYEAEARKLFDAELRKFNMDEHAYYVGCQGELDDADMAAIRVISAALAERDQLRADKLEMAAEATRWAEEAGRLKALLHDAQRDAERLMFAFEADGFVGQEKDRYDYAMDCAEEAGRDEPNAEDELNGVRRLIDAAMAAEREAINEP